MADASRLAPPAAPFRGIRPFRYADHAIFFAREDETRLLANLVGVYRGVFLYGDSGTGKSSLVSAGLFPEARRRGYEPVRVRVQPRTGEELVVEPIVASEGGELLRSVVVPAGDDTSQVVLSIAEFERSVRSAPPDRRTLVVFDQYEEIVTLFDGAPEQRDAIAQMIVRLLREPLPVKLVFAFREDYLGRIKQLLGACPELVDQALRLGPPSAGALEAIIRGPFERFPEHYEHELDAALARSLSAALAERFGSGEVSLSEVQTVCLRLWRSPDASSLLAAKGVQGLLEDELGEALDAFAPAERAAAVALLSEMVTAAGTRNVISAGDLRQRVREEDPEIDPALLDSTLERLERDAKLVRRERRRDLFLYEITSEFLVPWISHRRDELRLAQARRHERRRLRIVVAIALALLVVVALVAAIAIVAVKQRADARDQRERARSQAAAATSLALAGLARDTVRVRPDVALAFAYEAYRRDPQASARSALADAFLGTRRSGLRGVLTSTTAHHVGYSSDLRHGPQATVAGLAPQYDLSFSADGKTLATVGDEDGEHGILRLWRPRTGELLARLSVSGQSASSIQGGFGSVAVSPDGETVATAGLDRDVRVWSTRTHQLVGRLRGTRGGIGMVAFSPDGATIVTADRSPTPLRFWSTRSYRLRAAVPARGTGVVALAYRPDGDLLAVTYGTGATELFSAATRKSIALLRPPALGGSGGGGLAFSPDGATLAVAVGSAAVLWSTRTRKPVGRLSRPGTATTDVAYSHDGTSIATAYYDGAVRLWSAATRRPRRSLLGHAGAVRAVAFSHDDKLLATAGHDGTVRLWNPRAPAPFAPVVGSLAALGFDPSNARLIAVRRAGDVRIWSGGSQRPLATFSAHAPSVAGAALDERARRLVAVGGDGILRVTSLPTHRQLARFRVRSVGVDAPAPMAASPDGRLVAIAPFGGEISLYRIATRKPIASLRGGAAVGVAFNRAGTVLAAPGNRGVELWDTRRFTLIARLTGHTGAALAAAYSPDAKTLATGGADGTIRLWDATTRRPLARLTGHTGPVLALAFSRDSSALASGSADRTVRMWNVATHAPLARLTGHATPVSAVAFSPDGASVASASYDGVLRLWPNVLWRDLGGLREAVCGVLGAGLRREDWVRYAPGVPYRRTCP